MKLSSFIALVILTFILAGGTAVGANAPESCAIDNALTVNVRTLGAKGDGKTDDTPAFLAAIAQAHAGDGVIIVPRGEYRISQPLKLDKLTLTGSGARAWPSDIDALPAIIPMHRDGPAFILGGGSLLRGIDITYRWEKEPTNGPPAILITGIGIVIKDIRIRTAWDGIVSDGEHNVGRYNIENVFMVSIRNVGIGITGAWDVPRLNNIEIWNTNRKLRGFKKGTGFLLGKNDLIRITDCFVHGMNCGYRFEDKFEGSKIKGGTWGVMNGCSTDYCTTGMFFHGRHTMSISGGLFWNHSESLVVDGKEARIRVTGSELKSNGAPTVRINSCANTVISGCYLLRPMKRFTNPAVLLRGGKVVLGSNVIESHGPGVVVESGVRSAAITGNAIEIPDGQPAIIDHRGAKSAIVIESNAIVTTQKPPEPKVAK